MMSAREVCLGDVEFLVRESGRQRMIASGRKNVHAYAVGNLLDFVPVTEPGRMQDGAANGRPLHYDPVDAASFVDSGSLEPLTGASRAFFVEGGATYEGLRSENDSALEDFASAA